MRARIDNPPSAAQRLATAIRELGIGDAERAALFALMREFAGRRIPGAELVRLDRTAAAVQLLDAGLSRPVVRERLIARFRISRRTAERDIAEALDRRRDTATRRGPGWRGDTA